MTQCEENNSENNKMHQKPYTVEDRLLEYFMPRVFLKYPEAERVEKLIKIFKSARFGTSNNTIDCYFRCPNLEFAANVKKSIDTTIYQKNYIIIKVPFRE